MFYNPVSEKESDFLLKNFLCEEIQNKFVPLQLP